MSDVNKMTFGYPTEDMVWGQKVKAQGHGVATYFMRSSVPLEFALYRVTLDDNVYLLQNDDLHDKVGHPVTGR